jgi:restriction system protein
MARRRSTSFSKIMADVARAQARQQREFGRQAKARARAQAQAEKEAKRQYTEARAQETDEKNKELSERLSDLQSILEHTLAIDDTISFDDLRIHDEFRPPPQRNAFFQRAKKPGCLESLIPGVQGRYQRAFKQAEADYQGAVKKYEEDKQAFEQKVQQRDQEVAEFENAYRDNDPDAVSAYCTMVLERSEYPDGFPQEFRVAYVPESKQLVIEYELPGVGVVPDVTQYRYEKNKDSIKETSRKASEIKVLYQDIVASVCLRTVHEVFEADQNNSLEVVVFNGFAQAIDPATGRDIRPHLISVRTTKERFEEIKLSRIDKLACLRNLGAQVSSRPEEMLPVKPIIEFDMVDKRFVEQSDVLADLESRPNLMDLTPFEFENLVSNLFAQMGFETKQTRSSRDGGIDAVAYDTRPILGGKVVIQAKRYKNTVGVSAVRDLYGTMINEGANKGILVATSSYGPDAYDFSKDKPIELIDGGGLLYLLDQIGVRARIVFPED